MDLNVAAHCNKTTYVKCKKSVRDWDNIHLVVFELLKIKSNNDYTVKCVVRKTV